MPPSALTVCCAQNRLERSIEPEHTPLIVNQTKRYVFLEIPKNASTSLNAFFREDERVIDMANEILEVREYEPAHRQRAYARAPRRTHVPA